MKDKYIIIDLIEKGYIKDENGNLECFDTKEEAGVYCGMFEFDDAWICKLIYNHQEHN